MKMGVGGQGEISIWLKSPKLWLISIFDLQGEFRSLFVQKLPTLQRMRIFWKAYKLILEGKNKFGQRGWKLLVNVRIHVHFYAGFDDEFWSCSAGFCSPTPSVSSPPILPPLQNKDHHCTGKTHSFQKTTAIRVSRPFP